MELKRGTRVVYLTQEAQIAAYKRAGFVEVEAAPQKIKPELKKAKPSEKVEPESESESKSK